MAVERKDGVPSLRIEAGGGRALLLRYTDATLAVTPFLSWAWNMDQAKRGRHPVLLAVGFQGGASNSRTWGSGPPRWAATELPPHDRSLIFIWEASALRRGHLSLFESPSGGHGAYTVRGGAENTGVWHLETVDLSALYARAWPGDDIGQARIAFVGVAVEARPQPATAFVSGIVLSR